MMQTNRGWLLGMLVAALCAVGSFGCNGGASTPPPQISVTFSVSPATVEVGTTVQFTATVANDPANKGVNWSVSCSAPPCGSISPANTASGAPTIYTPPASQAASLTVNVTAASASDPSKFNTVPINIPAVSVTLSLVSATVQLGATASFSATVANDGASKGLTWSVSCPQTACGSVSPTTTASGASTTFSAPTAPPAGDLTVTLTATSATDSAVSASATITVPGIHISVSPSPVSVPSGGMQQFTATVTGDPNNGGVSWSVVRIVCNPLTRTCFTNPCSTCGTVSPASTASGAPVTYTAPPKRPFTYGGIAIQASSVTNTSALGRASINLLPISVSVSPTPANVALNTGKQFTATVTNDATNSGVTWTLTVNGVACSPGCGTVSPAKTASGAAATYTAPTTAPTLPVVTVTATSIEDTSKSASATITLTTATGAAACSVGSGSESLLKGQYAFLMHGSDPNGLEVTAGSFTADGTGKITAGEGDSDSPVSFFTFNATGSAYAVGADHRGCLVLVDTNGGTRSLRFALGSINSSTIATQGHIVEFDDTTGTGTRAAGTIRLQDATSFMASQFKGQYAFGVARSGNGQWAMAGTFAADGVSAITSDNLDSNTSGTLTSNASFTPAGSFTCCDANGQGTLALQISPNGPTNFVVYMIKNNDMFLVSTDGLAVGGEAIGIPAGTNFTQASLNGVAVLRSTAQSSGGPVVDLALVNADGKTAFTTVDNINNAGTFTSSSTAMNFTVASNGRVMFSGGSNPPVMYLYGPNQGFLVGTDANVTFGILEPQAAGPFTDASFSGAYMFGTENPPASSVTLESGVLTADGKGNAAGTSDQSSSTGLAQNQALNFAYSFAANGTGNVGSGTTAILISGNKLVFINNADPNPTITVVEK